MDLDLAERMNSAIEINPSVHDGALVFRRAEASGRYLQEHWSCRLAPPPIGAHKYKNRGSAFNSALAMSLLDDVDIVYFWSDEKIYRFVDGIVQELSLKAGA